MAAAGLQGFFAHSGEITCCASWVDPTSGRAFAMTGAVDFSVCGQAVPVLANCHARAASS